MTDFETQVLEKLDRITAILALANRQAIAEARQEIRHDVVAAAILDACGSDWVGGAELRERIGGTVDIADSTFRARVAELVAIGGLRQRGRTKGARYASTGLI